MGSCCVSPYITIASCQSDVDMLVDAQQIDIYFYRCQSSNCSCCQEVLFLAWWRKLWYGKIKIQYFTRRIPLKLPKPTASLSIMPGYMVFSTRLRVTHSVHVSLECESGISPCWCNLVFLGWDICPDNNWCNVRVKWRVDNNSTRWSYWGARLALDGKAL